MPEIVCPECGTRSELPAIRRSSDEFCPHCDYPLFWVSSAIAVTKPGANSDTTLRRLPGAGGRQRVGSKVCPECGELNPVTETHCLRCRADLDPKPPEPVVAVEQPKPVVRKPPPPPPTTTGPPDPRMALRARRADRDRLRGRHLHQHLVAGGPLGGSRFPVGFVQHAGRNPTENGRRRAPISRWGQSRTMVDGDSV